MKYNNYILILFAILLVGCTEPIPLNTQGFESVLVVEAVITNELKHQKIKLSRTFLLEENEQIIENNAIVIIKDSQQNNYQFSQNTNGIYVSNTEFEAIPNTTYTLEITTSNGKHYTSTPTQLTPISQMDQVYPELVDDATIGEAIQISLDSDNSGTDAKYFRYEYEETYKLVAPYYFPVDIIISNYNDQIAGVVTYDVDLIDNAAQEEICFQTRVNSEIIQTTTNQLLDNIISHFSIKKMAIDTGVIRDRYSILVKQYVQNIESYTFYKTINELGNVESILSANQPGFVIGNIASVTSPEEKVIGFFEVSSYSEKRIYFNYTNLNIDKPEYLYECSIFTTDYNDNTVTDGDLDERSLLYTLVTNLDYQFTVLPDDEIPPYPTHIFTTVNPECGDCTTVGSNIQPDFWED